MTHSNAELEPATTEPATSPRANSAPDWQIEQREIVCPLCGYNLRGLIEPRCPECGYRFDWDELLDPARALHPYLYEHHPERGIRSFWRTALAGLWPPKFWRTLSPMQPSKPRRLARYAINVLVLALLPLAAMLARYGFDGAAPSGPSLFSGAWPTAWWESFRFYSFEQHLPVVVAALINFLIRPTDTLHGFVLTFAATAVLWAIATHLALMIFQQSMGKAAVRKTHVARCVIYSADFALWPGVSLTAIVLAHWALGLDDEVYLWGTLLGGILALLFFPIATLRLIVAYRCYLRFDHPIATVLAVQMIVALAALLALSLCYVASVG